MKTRLLTTFSLSVLSIALTSGLQAQEYATVNMEIDIDAPAAEVWEMVGDYCDIEEWGGLPCEITSGNGEIGTVRSLFGGVVVEVLVGKTELSYGYTIPPRGEGFYDLFHGYMEARPVTDSTSKVVYTLILDVSNLEGEAKQNEIDRRRGQFEPLLVNMKNKVEGE
jgi:hypothetical protein